ncbi:MAG: hypothetical protein HY694_10890 [Deltaproteobacteria bacterium]|nr:hypothetical protein [Deltaproteobacteria bacterium]
MMKEKLVPFFIVSFLLDLFFSMSSLGQMKPKIAVFSGPTATLQNSPPLVTSNKARVLRALPPRTNPDGSPVRFDHLAPQRLAAPVEVLIEQFSAHPLEKDASHLYGPPDGMLIAMGLFIRPGEIRMTNLFIRLA